jgi:transposase
LGGFVEAWDIAADLKRRRGTTRLSLATLASFTILPRPSALVYFLKERGCPVNRIGFEAGPLSQWLHAGLTQARFETVLLETRHVTALSAMTVKTDRKDACGLAQLLRMGWFQQVHAKSIGSQEI